MKKTSVALWSRALTPFTPNSDFQCVSSTLITYKRTSIVRLCRQNMSFYIYSLFKFKFEWYDKMIAHRRTTCFENGAE